MRDCKRCGGETSLTNDTVKLFGGYTAHLCNNCISAFHQALASSDIWVTQIGLLARNEYLDSLTESGNPPPEEDVWLQLHLDQLKNQQAGWLFAEAFCQPLASYRDSRQRSRDAMKKGMNLVNADDSAEQ